MNAIEAMKLIAATEFSPVTEADREGLAGLESENPLIGYSADNWQIVIDGEDRKSTRLNSSHVRTSRMPSSA